MLRIIFLLPLDWQSRVHYRKVNNTEILKKTHITKCYLLLLFSQSCRQPKEMIWSLCRENSLFSFWYSISNDKYRPLSNAINQKLLLQKRANHTAKGRHRVLTPHTSHTPERICTHVSHVQAVRHPKQKGNSFR